MTIYVIDDHPLMRDAVASLLRRLRPGTRVVELACLGEIEPARQCYGAPNVIFLDLRLPDATGCTGVHQVKACLPDVPLAIYSALAAEDMEKSCLEAGADLYVEKTSDFRSLEVALDRLLTPSRLLDSTSKA